MSQKKTTEEFVKQAKRLHPDYDYSQVEYENSKKKVVIFCNKGHRFLQAPNQHLRGKSCPFCAGNVKVTPEDFKKRATEIHKGKYDYSLVDFKVASQKVKIICPIHGVFEQTAKGHLLGMGCRKCGRDSIRITDEEMKRRLANIYGDQYDFSISKWNGREGKIDFICPKHGIVQAQLRNLLRKRSFGCPKCYHESQRLTQEEFVAKAKEIHGDMFDYSNVHYVNATTPIELKCSFGHIFKTKPQTFLYSKSGCPICKSEALSMGEYWIRRYLMENGIEFEEQKRFPGCKYKHLLRFDFYIPKENICIEFQGEQHFKPVKRFGGLSYFAISQERDKIKREFCKTNGITLIEIDNKEKIHDEISKAIPYCKNYKEEW